MNSLTYVSVLYSICISIIAFTGFKVISGNPKSKSNQFFLAYCCSLIFWIIVLYLGWYYVPVGREVIDAGKGTLFFRLAFSSAAFMLTFQFLFLYYYTTEVRSISRTLKSVLLLASIFIFSTSLTPSVFQSIVIENGMVIRDEFGHLYITWIILTNLYNAASIGLIIYKIYHSQNIKRKKLIIIGIGLALFWLCLNLTNVLLPLFDIYVLQVESPLFTLFFISAVYYSIIRYRFLNVKFASPKQQEDLSHLLPELKKMGEVCLPLFSPSRELLGFFTLGKKDFNDPYSKEEIEAIRQLSSYLNLELTSILYKSELKKAVDRKTKDLQEILKQQSDFISVSAHEFRTPLNIALLQTEVLEKSLEDSPKQKFAQKTHKALKQIHSLTNQIFEAQRYDLKKVQLKLQPTNIHEFLEDMYANFAPLMRQGSIDFSFQNKLPKDLKIKIDATQIYQVLQNLLTNAKKFTPAKGVVHVRAGIFGKNKVRVCIADSGTGISDDNKKTIFEKFRSEESSKGTGIGLGLYISKKIITMHKGKIWVQDAPDGGAEFCFWLPIG